MGQLLIRGLDSQTISRVRASARARGTSTPDEAARLLVEALDAREARTAGAAAVNSQRTPEERSEAARRASLARWALRETRRDAQ